MINIRSNILLNLMSPPHILKCVLSWNSRRPRSHQGAWPARTLARTLTHRWYIVLIASVFHPCHEDADISPLLSRLSRPPLLNDPLLPLLTLQLSPPHRHPPIPPQHLDGLHLPASYPLLQQGAFQPNVTYGSHLVVLLGFLTTSKML